MVRCFRVERAQLREAVWIVSCLFLSSRMLLALIAIAGPLFFKADRFYRGRIGELGWQEYFNRWDVGWYARIAVEGYGLEPSGANASAAFFPLWPLLLRLFHSLGIDALVAGLILANVCFFFALWNGYCLARDELSDRLASRVAVLMAFSPATVWFSIGLTESLYLLLTVLFVRAAQARRWNWMMATGLLAGLTRPNGFLLALPAAALVLPHCRSLCKEQRYWQILPPIAGITAPVIAYFCFLAFLQYMTGNWRSHYLASSTYWFHCRPTEICETGGRKAVRLHGLDLPQGRG